MTFDLEDAKKRGIMLRGLRGRIICSDAAGGFPVIVLLETVTMSSIVWAKADGQTGDGSYLQNLPREVTVWVAVRESGGHETYRNEMMARGWCDRQRARGNAAGCAPVTITLKR